VGIPAESSADYRPSPFHVAAGLTIRKENITEAGYALLVERVHDEAGFDAVLREDLDWSLSQVDSEPPWVVYTDDFGQEFDEFLRER
jgi:hypothetical protein